MSAEGVARFISVVALHFPRPKFNEDEVMEAAWVASMNRTLGGFSDEVLADAAERIVSSRHPKKDGRFFPTPAECSSACVEASKLIAASETPLLAKPKGDDWSDDRLALAFDLVRGEMGKRAAREGWAARLYNFCRINMRLPNAQEAFKCQEEARSLEVAIRSYEAKLEAATTTEDVAFLASIVQMAGTITAERQKLEQRILRGAA